MNKKNNKGFSLLELSIVLIILSMVTVGSIDIATGVLKSAKLKDTKNKLAVIEQAINAYVIENGALPCPAGMKLKNTNSTFGSASCEDNSSVGLKEVDHILVGTVPTKSLKIEAKYMQDGWGDRFIYIVSKDMAHIQEAEHELRHSVPKRYLINSIYAYAVISNGENKNGAIRDIDLATVKNSGTEISDDEKTNTFDNMENNVKNNVFTIAISNEYKSFDDILLTKSKGNIVQATQYIDIGCSFEFTEITNYTAQAISKMNSELEANKTCMEPGSNEYLRFTETDLDNANFNYRMYAPYGSKIYSSNTYENVEDISENLRKRIVTECVAECGAYGKFMYYPKETITIENRN